VSGAGSASAASAVGSAPYYTVQAAVRLIHRLLVRRPHVTRPIGGRIVEGLYRAAIAFALAPVGAIICAPAGITPEASGAAFGRPPSSRRIEAIRCNRSCGFCSNGP